MTREEHFATWKHGYELGLKHGERNGQVESLLKHLLMNPSDTSVKRRKRSRKSNDLDWLEEKGTSSTDSTTK